MREHTSLYRIKPHARSSSSIVVETTTPAQPSSPHILFCGGFHSSMLGNKASYLKNLASLHHWGFTRFDYRGHGQSDGRFEDYTLNDWLQDALAILDRVYQVESRAICVVGSSMGAWLAVHMAMLRPLQINSLITIAAAPDFTQELLWPSLSSDQQAAILNGQTISIDSRYDDARWPLRFGLFESGRNLALLDNPAPLPLKCAVRMLHGTADVDVPPQQSQRLLSRLNHSINAQLKLVTDGDHRLSDPLSLDLLNTAVVEMVSNYR